MPGCCFPLNRLVTIALLLQATAKAAANVSIEINTSQGISTCASGEGIGLCLPQAAGILADAYHDACGKHPVRPTITGC